MSTWILRAKDGEWWNRVRGEAVSDELSELKEDVAPEKVLGEMERSRQVLRTGAAE